MTMIRTLLLVGFFGMIASMSYGAEKKADVQAKADVRKLTFTPTDRKIYFNLGGKHKTTPLADAAAAKKLLGDEQAKQLLKQVDFTKEQIVLVSWSTGGPPMGVLSHEVDGNGKTITFYVQGPKGNMRNDMLKMGIDFFAVPKGLAVSFEKGERPYKGK